MGLFSSLFGTRIDTAAKAAIRSQIDLAQAVEAHVQWKVRLQNYIEGKSDENLDPMVICRDDQCALGKWIHGPAMDYFHDAEAFHELRADHAQFHFVAGTIVQKIQANDRPAAEKLFHGEYAKVSHKVMIALTELNNMVGKS